MEFLTGCLINVVIFSVIVGVIMLLTPLFNQPWFMVIAGLLLGAFLVWRGRDLPQTFRDLYPEGSREQKRANCLFIVFAYLLAMIVLLGVWALMFGPPPNHLRSFKTVS